MNFHWRWGDGIESRLPFKIFSTLTLQPFLLYYLPMCLVMVSHLLAWPLCPQKNLEKLQLAQPCTEHWSILNRDLRYHQISIWFEVQPIFCFDVKTDVNFGNFFVGLNANNCNLETARIKWLEILHMTEFKIRNKVIEIGIILSRSNLIYRHKCTEVYFASFLSSGFTARGWCIKFATGLNIINRHS